MDLWLWKEELVRDAASARVRAKNGMAYLDARYGATWHQQIDLEKLDIGSPFGCVLGQLSWNGACPLVSPRRGVDCGFSLGIVFDCVSLFARIPILGPLLPLHKLTRSFALLTEAWKDLLRERRRPAAKAWATMAAARFRRGVQEAAPEAEAALA